MRCALCDNNNGVGIWVGVVLDSPVGKNNGSVLKKQYFRCLDNHGVFVQPHAVTLLRARPRPEVLTPGKLVEFRQPLPRNKKQPLSGALTAVRCWIAVCGVRFVAVTRRWRLRTCALRRSPYS